MKKPPNSPMANRSNSTRQVAGNASKAVIDKGSGGKAAGEAHARSRANSEMPMEPKGTSPISTCLDDSRSHSSEPQPMPSVKTPSSRVTLVSVPPSTSLA